MDYNFRANHGPLHNFTQLCMNLFIFINDFIWLGKFFLFFPIRFPLFSAKKSNCLPKNVQNFLIHH
jgi:hypothetical protein